MCFYYSAGNCQRGNQCKFSHGKQPRSNNIAVPIDMTRKPTDPLPTQPITTSNNKSGDTQQQNQLTDCEFLQLNL